MYLEKYAGKKLDTNNLDLAHLLPKKKKCYLQNNLFYFTKVTKNQSFYPIIIKLSQILSNLFKI